MHDDDLFKNEIQLVDDVKELIWATDASRYKSENNTFHFKYIEEYKPTSSIIIEWSNLTKKRSTRPFF